MHRYTLTLLNMQTYNISYIHINSSIRKWEKLLAIISFVVHIVVVFFSLVLVIQLPHSLTARKIHWQFILIVALNIYYGTMARDVFIY